MKFSIRSFAATCVLCVAIMATPAHADAKKSRGPLVHTYSIVAYDAERGEIGVAVQSHFFAVGPIVPWVEPGVGVVATQSVVDVSYGPLGLDLMRGGKSAEQALAGLWKHGGLPQAALARIAFTGSDPVLPSSFRVATAAFSVIP